MCSRQSVTLYFRSTRFQDPLDEWFVRHPHRRRGAASVSGFAVTNQPLPCAVIRQANGIGYIKRYGTYQGVSWERLGEGAVGQGAEVASKD